MHLFLLGATGRTGKHILQQALERGHKVNVLVRDRRKIQDDHPLLSIWEGNPLDGVSLKNAMVGCQAIISALNISRTSDWPWAKLRTPKDFLSSVMKLLIKLAPENGVKRIIFISAWGVAETRKDIPGWFRWFIDHSNIRYPYEDHERQENLLKNTSLEWTAIRPAGLTNFKKPKNIIISIDNSPRPHLTISRKNLACFIIDTVERQLYPRNAPVISE